MAAEHQFLYNGQFRHYGSNGRKANNSVCTVLIGGIFILLAGIFFGVVGLVLTLPLGGFGAAFGILGVLWEVPIIFGAVMMETAPTRAQRGAYLCL